MQHKRTARQRINKHGKLARRNDGKEKNRREIPPFYRFPFSNSADGIVAKLTFRRALGSYLMGAVVSE